MPGDRRQWRLYFSSPRLSGRLSCSKLPSFFSPAPASPLASSHGPCCCFRRPTGCAGGPAASLAAKSAKSASRGLLHRGGDETVERRDDKQHQRSLKQCRNKVSG